jgi:hypothetical protein
MKDAHMMLDVPELSSILPRMMDVGSTFMGQKRPIREWVTAQRQDIQKNLVLVRYPSDENDIAILLSFLRDLLVRAMRGEAGELTYQKLKAAIRNKSCLQDQIYVKALEAANYRWGPKAGSELISKVVGYFDGQLKWNWREYLNRASAEKQTNFANDPLLTIKNIGFKVRDLALSSFDPSYAAFDLHVSRVPTRIGLLNYGYELLGDPVIEMGNNPADQKNYLFLHKLFLKLSDMTNNEISPADLDRIFWHFGRTYCSSSPKCSVCPISNECLTGKLVSSDISKVAENRPIRNRRLPVGEQSGEIGLPYGEPQASFPIQDLVDYLQAVKRNYIIIGGANCTFAEHTKFQSLDYWIRKNYTNRKDTRQAVKEVINKLVASNRFEEREGLICPDSRRHCKGLTLID